MRFLIDECVADEIGRQLRQKGHNVAFVREIALSANDIDILPLGIKLERIIVTYDFDYGDLIFRDGVRSLGVIIIVQDFGIEDVSSRDATITAKIDELRDSLVGTLTTIGQKRFRQRILPTL
jgi:predicted nuclease of predicted toxin-antitoxin system